MKIGYRDNRLAKTLSSAKEIQKNYGQMSKKIAQRLDEMADSPNLAVLQSIPAAKCHPLTQNRSGQWAVSISGNYRLIFEIDHHPVPVKDDGSIDTIIVTDIVLIETTDYHSK